MLPLFNFPTNYWYHDKTDSICKKLALKSTQSSHSTDMTCNLSKKLPMGACILATMLTLTACQTTQSVSQPNATTNMVGEGQQTYPELLQSFNIRGKIGITTPQTDTQSAQSGSAFYVWAQEDNRFAIDITGALGIGHTVIEYNGTTATLVSQQAGEVTASSPEELLYQATGWQAPISQLRYWISGRPAPSDDQHQVDEYGRLQTSHNEDWTANFTYQDNDANHSIPSKIKVVRNDGYKVIMTINHNQN